MPISIVIIDDSEVFRQSLRIFLEDQDGVALVGEAENGKQGLELIERLQPDVVLLDWVMPEVSGLEVLRTLALKRARPHVIVVTTHADESYSTSAIENGAIGYILKEDIVHQLRRALLTVISGKVYCCPEPQPNQPFSGPTLGAK